MLGLSTRARVVVGGGILAVLLLACCAFSATVGGRSLRAS